MTGTSRRMGHRRAGPWGGGGDRFGDTHAHGTEGVHFFTRGKVVTSRWPDLATRQAMDRGFPQHS